MDIRERTNDYEESIRMALDARQGRIWTAMPAIIVSFDPVAMTCEVQPSVQGRVTQLTPDKQSSFAQYMSLPPLFDCPVIFPSGGGYTMTFPLAAGDECLVVFGCRGIDFWWQSGGVQPPAEARMHDLSDGFVIPGPFSQPRAGAALPDVSPDTVQLRSAAGEVVLGVNKAGVTVTGSNGNLSVDGNSTSGTGVTATFTTMTGQIVTVTNGLITNIN